MQAQTSANESRHRFIKGYLAMRGVSFSEVAKQAEVSRQMVSAVSKGERRSEKVEKVLAKHGIPESFLAAR